MELSLLGQWIDEVRARDSFSFEAMAHRVGVARDTLRRSRLLGERIQAGSLQKIARYFGKPVEVCLAAMGVPAEFVPEVPVTSGRKVGGAQVIEEESCGLFVPDHYPFATHSGIVVMPRVAVVGDCRGCEHAVLCLAVVNRGGLALCERVFDWELLPDAVRVWVEANCGDLMEVVYGSVGVLRAGEAGDGDCVGGDAGRCTRVVREMAGVG